MRSTPTTACGIDVDIEPLGLRREGAVIEMVERFKRSDRAHLFFAILQIHMWRISIGFLHILMFFFGFFNG